MSQDFHEVLFAKFLGKRKFVIFNGAMEIILSGDNCVSLRNCDESSWLLVWTSKANALKIWISNIKTNLNGSKRYIELSLTGRLGSAGLTLNTLDACMI